MYYIPQITTNDCLFTSFKILLANAKGDERFLYLQEDENHGPYSFFEIIEKAKQYGVELFGFESDDKKELKNCKNIPLILNIKKGNKNLHSVYVYKVTNAKVYFLDSDAGKVSMKFSKFIQCWDGTGLMTRKISNSGKEPTFKKLTVKRNPLFIVFQTFSAICFILGIYFADANVSLWISLLLILGGAAFECLNKIVQVRDMKKFDNETVELLTSIQNEDYSEFLPRREKLKLSLFDPKNNFLFYLLSCLFATFVVLFNNPYNFICVIIPILFATLQCVFVSKIEKRKSFELENLEVKFSREKNKDSALGTLKEIETKSYNFAFFVLTKNLVGIVGFFISAFITLIAFDAFNLINAFFLIFIEVFLYQNLIPIFSYENKKVEEKVNYLRFINLFQ